jgi:putative lipoic acid-binding regulatory protein
MTEQPSLIKYPCEFPIKIMGKSGENFIQTTFAIVKSHAPNFDDAAMEVRTSKKGTYLSITCTIQATSRTQLDALYQELYNHPLVSIVL